MGFWCEDRLVCSGAAAHNLLARGSGVQQEQTHCPVMEIVAQKLYHQSATASKANQRIHDTSSTQPIHCSEQAAALPECSDKALEQKLADSPLKFCSTSTSNRPSTVHRTLHSATHFTRQQTSQKDEQLQALEQKLAKSQATQRQLQASIDLRERQLLSSRREAADSAAALDMAKSEAEILREELRGVEEAATSLKASRAAADVASTGQIQKMQDELGVALSKAADAKAEAEYAKSEAAAARQEAQQLKQQVEWERAACGRLECGGSGTIVARLRQLRCSFFPPQGPQMGGDAEVAACGVIIGCIGAMDDATSPTSAAAPTPPASDSAAAAERSGASSAPGEAHGMTAVQSELHQLECCLRQAAEAAAEREQQQLQQLISVLPDSPSSSVCGGALCSVRSSSCGSLKVGSSFEAGGQAGRLTAQLLRAMAGEKRRLAARLKKLQQQQRAWPLYPRSSLGLPLASAGGGGGGGAQQLQWGAASAVGVSGSWARTRGSAASDMDLSVALMPTDQAASALSYPAAVVEGRSQLRTVEDSLMAAAACEAAAEEVAAAAQPEAAACCPASRGLTGTSSSGCATPPAGRCDDTSAGRDVTLSPDHHAEVDNVLQALEAYSPVTSPVMSPVTAGHTASSSGPTRWRHTTDYSSTDVAASGTVMAAVGGCTALPGPVAERCTASPDDLKNWVGHQDVITSPHVHGLTASFGVSCSSVSSVRGSFRYGSIASDITHRALRRTSPARSAATSQHLSGRAAVGIGSLLHLDRSASSAAGGACRSPSSVTHRQLTKTRSAGSPHAPGSRDGGADGGSKVGATRQGREEQQQRSFKQQQSAPKQRQQRSASCRDGRS